MKSRSIITFLRSIQYNFGRRKNIGHTHIVTASAGGSCEMRRLGPAPVCLWPGTSCVLSGVLPCVAWRAGVLSPRRAPRVRPVRPRHVLMTLQCHATSLKFDALQLWRCQQPMRRSSYTTAFPGTPPLSLRQGAPAALPAQLSSVYLLSLAASTESPWQRLPSCALAVCVPWQRIGVAHPLTSSAFPWCPRHVQPVTDAALLMCSH